MTEKEFHREFAECANRDDFEGCLAALEGVSAEVINRQCDDGYDMLISAVMSGNPCAVEALLADGRCDRTNREGLCGLTAEEFALNEPEDSRVRIAFEESLPAQYIYREEKLIPREEIFHLIMTDQLEADEDNNVVRGLHKGIDTKNCIIVGDSDKLIATVDVQDLVVVNTDDSLLVCSAKSAQKIKELVNLLEKDPQLNKFV